MAAKTWNIVFVNIDCMLSVLPTAVEFELLYIMLLNVVWKGN